MMHDKIESRLEMSVFKAIYTSFPKAQLPDWVETIKTAIMDVAEGAEQSLLITPAGHLVESGKVVSGLKIQKLVRWYRRLAKV